MTMSRSASMYNSPYTYKPPPPKIDYPFFFSGCTNITCRYVLDSTILAVSVLLLLIANVVIVGMLISPYWFVLTFDRIDGSFGIMSLGNLSVESGLFFLKASELDNWIFTDTFSGRDAVPKQLQAAQFFAVFGSCILVPSFAAGIMLMCRRLSSPTGLLIMAGAVSLAGFCEVLVVILCGDVFIKSSCSPLPPPKCRYRDNLTWRMIPMYTQLYRNEPDVTPQVTPSWSYYIVIAGAGLTIASAVCFWIEALVTCRSLGQIRYQQLRQARDQFEYDVDPYAGKKYMYQPPHQHGPNSYGLQPVVHSVRYDGTVLAPAPMEGYIPPSAFYTQPPSPRYDRRGGPPSTISSTSGPIVSREIDL